MRLANRKWTYIWGLAAGLSYWSACAAAEPVAAPSSDIVTGTWQHHKLTFSYFGFTTLFTCDGLEDHVRLILLHLGARKDAKVSATGCPGPYNAPSSSAFVGLDFYTLVPATADGGSDTVKARWTPVELTGRRPSFMEDGDCELIQEMKDVITKNFSLRNIEYRTDCVPREVRLDAFAVKGQALKALTLNAAAVKG